MMEKVLKDFTYKKLKKVYKRLKKDTKCFSSLIVREPLDYVDFEINIKEEINNIIYIVQSGNYTPSRPYIHLTAKGKGINRPTVVLNIVDSLIYRYCVEALEDTLIGETRNNPNIHGGIKITANKIDPDGDTFYEKWFDDWKEYHDSLIKSLDDDNFVMNSDIASYFENINITTLKDLIFSCTKNKKEVLNLLFHFIEYSKIKNNYEASNGVGLLQEDIDCSRILAYFFLHEHDNRVIDFCSKENTREYYRYADDMSVVVGSEVEGRKALKLFTESLRKLNLVASIQKTSIVSAKEMKKELFVNENNKLDDIQDTIENCIENKKPFVDSEKQLITLYNECLNSKLDGKKNWIKLKKRFYTLFSFVESDYLIEEIKKDLVYYPKIFGRKKLLKIIIQLSDKEKIKKAIEVLIDFLKSEENLYPELETNIIETLSAIPEKYIDDSLKDSIAELGELIFWKKRGYVPQSEYARALAVFLIYRYGSAKLKLKLEKHYVNAEEDDYLVRKYLITYNLISNNQNIRRKTKTKASKDNHESVKRLLSFIENVDQYEKSMIIERYLERNKLFVLKKKGSKHIKIVKSIFNVRANILEELIKIYKSN